MQNFEKLKINLTSESIYMKEKCGLKKHTSNLNLSHAHTLLRIITYGIKQGVSPDLFPLIWNPLNFISTQATKYQLGWGQLKFYKV